MVPSHSEAASAGATLPAKAFIFRHYIRLFGATALFSLVLLLSLMVYQARTLNRIYIEKTKDVIQLHRNELLNEIALGDFASLTQHLNYMLNEMNADQVVLHYGGHEYRSATRGADRQTLFSRMLSGIGGVRPFRVDVANEFGTFQAVLQVTYVQSLVAWMLSPVFFSILTIVALSWMPVALVFVVIFRRIRNNFIDPLNAVTASLRDRNSKSSLVRDPAAPLVEEIVQLQRACEQYRLVETEAAFAQIARQVTHDIRSPLAALDTLLSLIDDLPEEQRVLLRTAIGRIRDLSNNLLNKTKASATASTESSRKDAAPPSVTSEFLAGLVETVVSEKRQQHRAHAGVEIIFEPDAATYDIFVNVDPERMKRVLSNLFDNALEALGEAGRISAFLRHIEDRAELIIRDNGRGIPVAILPTLMERGRTHGKPGGSGLGLAFARECVTGWGGDVRLDSIEGQGTDVLLRLPCAAPPGWFVPALNVSPGTTVVVVDDDPSIHEVWNSRFRGIASDAASIKLVHVMALQELEQFCEMRRGVSSSILYLCDFEFRGDKQDGLSAIERLGIAKASVLVTSRAEEPDVRARCLSLSVPMLPKMMAAVVPIRAV